MEDNVLSDDLRASILSQVLKPKVQEIKTLESKPLKENIDLDPHMFIMAGHNPRNIKYVWFYDTVEAKLVGSLKAGSHFDAEFSNILNKKGVIRGRVFVYQGKTILIIYGEVAGERNPSNEEIRDIYLKISEAYPENIDYVVDELGNNLNNILESKSGVVELKETKIDSTKTLLEQCLEHQSNLDSKDVKIKNEIHSKVMESINYSLLEKLFKKGI